MQEGGNATCPCVSSPCLRRDVWNQVFHLRLCFCQKFLKNRTYDAFLIWPSVALVRTLIRTCEHPVIWAWWFLAMICWPWICWAATVRRRRRSRWSLMFVQLGGFLTTDGWQVWCWTLLWEKGLWHWSSLHGMCDDFIVKGGILHKTFIFVQHMFRAHICHKYQNLSCGENSDFCKEFEQFMEFYRNLCRFLFEICVQKNLWRKSVWLKNDKYEVCNMLFASLKRVKKSERQY